MNPYQCGEIMPRYQIEPTQRTRGEKLQKLRQRVFSTYGDICWLCGGGEADTIDHVIPLSDGGDDDIDNLRPAHGRKSASCVGNYSRKRPAYTGEKPRNRNESRRGSRRYRPKFFYAYIRLTVINQVCSSKISFA
jgi:hypothetical protein